MNSQSHIDCKMSTNSNTIRPSHRHHSIIKRKSAEEIRTTIYLPNIVIRIFAAMEQSAQGISRNMFLFTTAGAHALQIVENICRRSMWKCGLHFSGCSRSSIYQLSMKLLKSTSACRHELIHHSYIHISDTRNGALFDDIYRDIFLAFTPNRSRR